MRILNPTLRLHALTSLLFFTSMVISSPELPAPLEVRLLNTDATITRIAIGSCFAPQLEHGIWEAVVSVDPELFLFMGDNVYAESESNDVDLPALKEGYRLLSEVLTFKQLLEQSFIMTTWDDHDYGMNDAGENWIARTEAEALYEHFWAVTDERKQRPGVYYSRIFGPMTKRVQIIMLDTRFFRSDLRLSLPNERDQSGKFAPSDDKNKSMLGTEQWAWLKHELKKPAELRLIVSSVAIVQDQHNMEGWRTLPKERQKLFDLITETGAKGVVLLSGDRHFAGIYREEMNVPYPLTEIMSSSMNLPITGETAIKYFNEQEPRRIGDSFMHANFGLLSIDWPNRELAFEIRNQSGLIEAKHIILIDSLQPQS